MPGLQLPAPVVPSPADVALYHGKGGYLERFREAYPRAWEK